MSYDISDMSDMPKWRRGAVGLSRHAILSSDMSDISDISEMSDMSDIPYTQHTYRHPPPSSYFKTQPTEYVLLFFKTQPTEYALANDMIISRS